MTPAATGNPLPIHHDPIGKLIDTLPDTSAAEVARKRRRENFTIQSGNLLANENSAAATSTTADISPAAGKKLKIMIGQSVNKLTKPPCVASKRPQMKYNPDIPMAKEDVSRWRKEERRKRNRESAAASRQRQRDRITELELEVEDWKSKFESVMEKIIQLDGLNVTNNIPSHGSVDIKTEPIFDEVIAPVNISMTPLPCFSFNSPVSSSVPIDITSKVTPCGGVNEVSEEEGEPQQSNMISRPAELRIISFILDACISATAGFIPCLSSNLQFI